MAVSKRLRFEVLRRDGYTCRYCGAQAPEVKLTVDHVTPVALGGLDRADNLVAACGPCNSGKSSATPDQETVTQVAEDAVRWARAVAIAAEAASEDLYIQRMYCEFIIDHWVDSTAGQPSWKQAYIPADFESSIEAFRIRGMPLDILTKAASKALDNALVRPGDKWRYFMGAAWKMLAQIEEVAKKEYDKLVVPSGS